MNWIENIVHQHSELESPASFWYWSAVTSIAAVVKDNIWLNRQIYNLYPNVYVMFHADSGLKKGPPVSMAKRLVSAVNNTKIIGGRSSIQGILKDLGTGQGHTLPGGKIVKNDKSVAFICSSELSSSIVEDKVATKILTDLYDRQYNIGEWRSLLKMETFTLKDPTITMLTATNEAMTEDFFTKSAIQGGYFARTFIVYEKEGENINSLSVPLKIKIDYPQLAEYLKVLTELKGEFQPLGSREQSDIFIHPIRNLKNDELEYFSESGVIYEEWYHKFRLTLKRTQLKDETGTLNRFGDSVLKVAMLLSLARNPELVVTPDAMREAIVVCQKLIGNLRETTLGTKGLSPTKSLKTAIMKEIHGREGHKITRAGLMNGMWMHFGSPGELDELLNSMEQAGMIQYEFIGNNVIIKMTESQTNYMNNYFSGKDI